MVKEMGMTRCNHIVGFWAGYDGGGTVSLDECLADPSSIVEMNTWFIFCPTCGADVEKLGQQLRLSIPGLADCAKIILGDGEKHKVPEKLERDDFDIPDIGSE